MLQELILSASYGTLGLHDLTTGALAINFKNANLSTSSGAEQTANTPQGSSQHTAGGSLPPRKGTGYVETSDGQGGYVAGCGGQGKGAVNVWSFAKEAPIQRSLMAVRLNTMALSPSGIYLAGGSHDGRILIWQMSTGALLTSYDAHYRAITCLAWTNDDAALVSGSEDALLHVWSLPAVLSSRRDPNLAPAPYSTLSDHSLPITDISIGMGIFPRVRLMTASSDGSCKLWDLTIPTLPLLTTFNFPAPAQVTHLALDPSERFFFAAYSRPEDSLAEKGQASTSKVDSRRTSVVQRVDLFNGGESIGGTGQGDIQNAVGGNTYTSTDQITALHLSSLSPHLIIGTAASQVHILALPSLQSIRTITLGAGQTLPSPNPVTYLSTMARPVDLAGRTGQKESVLVRQVAQLGREIQSLEQRKAEVCWVRVTGDEDVTKFIAPHLVQAQATSESSAAATVQVVQRPMEVDASGMQAENAKLKEQLAKALHMNERMWAELVERNLGTT